MDSSVGLRRTASSCPRGGGDRPSGGGRGEIGSDSIMIEPMASWSSSPNDGGECDFDEIDSLGSVGVVITHTSAVYTSAYREMLPTD